MANKVLSGIDEYTVVFYTHKLNKNLKQKFKFTVTYLACFKHFFTCV